MIICLLSLSPSLPLSITVLNVMTNEMLLRYIRVFVFIVHSCRHFEIQMYLNGFYCVTLSLSLSLSFSLRVSSSSSFPISSLFNSKDLILIIRRCIASNSTTGEVGGARILTSHTSPRMTFPKVLDLNKFIDEDEEEKVCSIK